MTHPVFKDISGRDLNVGDVVAYAVGTRTHSLTIAIVDRYDEKEKELFDFGYDSTGKWTRKSLGIQPVYYIRLKIPNERYDHAKQQYVCTGWRHSTFADTPSRFVNVTGLVPEPTLDTLD